MIELRPHVKDSKSSYIREILNVTQRDEVISLAGGLPCPSLFPMQIIEEVMPSLAVDRSLFQYSSTAGYQPLLNELRIREQIPNTHQMLVTSGAQQGIDLCVRAFIGRGDKVVTEQPSYLGALQIFSFAQADILTVKNEKDGPNLPQLEKHFLNNKVKLFYAVPDFHNPTGCCWSLHKRKEVARLCQRHNVLLLEDAPYRNLRFSGEALPTVSSQCPEISIMLRSFSKVVAPAMRVGTLTAPKYWMLAITKLKQAADLHTNSPMQKLCLEIIRHPEFDAHVEKLNREYKHRYLALADELSFLPKSEYSFQSVEGGMFIWLKIPPCNTLSLAKSALSNGVAIVPGCEFYANSQNAKSALRLNFSNNEPHKIKQALNRLRPVLELYRTAN